MWAISWPMAGALPGSDSGPIKQQTGRTEMLRKICILILATVFCAIGFGTAAYAHNLWLNPGDYFPEVGKTVEIGIGWGHKYPANRVDQEIKEGRVEAIKAVDPDGKIVDLSKVSAALYTLKIDKPGAWLVTARIKQGFFTKTPQGRKWGDKKTVANAIKCTNFHIQAKTFLIAGNSDKSLTQTAGQPLEMVPLTNFQRMEPGDALSIKLLFDGKPLPDAKIRATYAGFEADDVAPHRSADKGSKGHGRHFPVETITDAQGQADLKLEKAGYWMIVLSHDCRVRIRAAMGKPILN
jgi:uncharacterized GH25 family protein